MTHHASTRRRFLTQGVSTLAGAAGTAAFPSASGAAPPKPETQRIVFDLNTRPPVMSPQAGAMISLFMQGGPSHLDLFDPKPELTRHHLQTSSHDFGAENASQASRKLFASPWRFRQHGQCGNSISELLPNLAAVVDEICLIRSMSTGSNGHEPSIALMNTGRMTRGRPSLGSWLAYSLGTVCRDLPAFVVLTDPGGLPVLGVENWNNGWLPSIFQGTVIRSREPRILNLEPPPQLQGLPQKKIIAYLQQVNAAHLRQHPHESDLSARMQSYQLAAEMQTAAKEAMDLSSETAETQKLYGLDDPATQEYGTRCLIARRLVERGVRFVQIHTGNQSWDHHGNIRTLLPAVCLRTDKPAAALVLDLKQRGLLDTTLVHWGGEMGRLPVIQNEQDVGRDHNGQGFSQWMAGGGIRGGMVYGETDELGHRAVTDVVTHVDYLTTVLHLLGIDSQTASFVRAVGSDGLLEGEQGKIVAGILNRPPA